MNFICFIAKCINMLEYCNDWRMLSLLRRLHHAWVYPGREINSLWLLVTSGDRSIIKRYQNAFQLQPLSRPVCLAYVWHIMWLMGSQVIRVCLLPSVYPSINFKWLLLTTCLDTIKRQPATKPRKHVSTRMPTTSVALRGRRTQPAASPNLSLFPHRKTSPQSAPLSPFPHRTWKIRRAGRQVDVLGR